MIKKEVKVLNQPGMNMCSTVLLAKTAAKFACDIKLVKGDMKVNAKSISGIATLAVGCGASLEVIAEGKDEAEAVQAITELFANRFGEDQDEDRSCAASDQGDSESEKEDIPKKTILFIDRNYFPGRNTEDMSGEERFGNPGYLNYCQIKINLQKKYDVTARWNFGEGVYDTFHKYKNVYDALITHVPFHEEDAAANSSFNSSYGRSIDILKRIRKENPDLCIIIYTGADAIFGALRDINVCNIVKKTGNYEYDLSQIKKYLAAAFAKKI